MPRCHLKISNANVIDGSGTGIYQADIAVESERIIKIGQLEYYDADEKINAEDLNVAPGFIDVHTHDDSALLKTPDMQFKTSQGVTTVIAGNCGISLAPFKQQSEFPAPFPLLGEQKDFVFPNVSDYRNQFDIRPAATNVALLAGHSSLRIKAMSREFERRATESEINQMKKDLHLAMQQGCIGLSTGLDYPPALQSSTEEIISVAKVLNEFENAVFTSHIRDETDFVLEAVEEALEIGKKSNIPLVISHHKCAGPKNYGRSVETLATIQKAQSKGQQVAMDVYPYIASSTTLLPRFVNSAEKVIVSWSKPYPEHNGRLLDEIASQWECSLKDAVEKLYPAAAIYFQMDEQDLKRIMQYPVTMIGSDGLPGHEKPHPRLWATFPRVLKRYVREQQLLTLEQAVHKMTGLSAKTFGLIDRGLLKPGYFADLVIFDPETIEDMADFENPELPSKGIHSVFANGKPVWQQNHPTQNRPGQFLTH